MSHLTKEQENLIELVKDELHASEENVVGSPLGAIVIPKFAEALLKSIGYKKVVSYGTQALLDKHPKNWGKEQENGFEEKVSECHSRGAKGDIIWRKTGDR